MSVKENIKIVGEVGDVRVLIATCKWAVSNRLQSCLKRDCDNYVYGTVSGNEKPYIIGWCHDLDVILTRAEGWVRMLEHRHRFKLSMDESKEKIQDKKKSDAPGYL